MVLSVRQKILGSVTRSGQFLMENRREAVVIAMLTAAIPLLGWISLVVMCLVTLRKGAREGLFVLAWAVIPAVISNGLMGSWSFALENLIAYVWLWSMACLLRVTTSWRYVLEVSTGIAVLVIIVIHMVIPDLDKIYLDFLMAVYKNSISGAVDPSNPVSNPVSYAAMQGYMQQIVYYLLGVQVTLYLGHNLLCLLIARGWQAVLYNPKGLSHDLKMIRLGWIPWVAALILVFFGINRSLPWAMDTLPVLAALFFFAGLSLVHYVFKIKLPYRGAVPILYILLILLLPFSIVPMVLLAFIDTGWNIRKNFKEVKCL